MRAQKSSFLLHQCPPSGRHSSIYTVDLPNNVCLIIGSIYPMCLIRLSFTRTVALKPYHQCTSRHSGTANRLWKANLMAIPPNNGYNDLWATTWGASVDLDPTEEDRAANGATRLCVVCTSYCRRQASAQRLCFQQSFVYSPKHSYSAHNYCTQKSNKQSKYTSFS